VHVTAEAQVVAAVAASQLAADHKKMTTSVIGAKGLTTDTIRSMRTRVAALENDISARLEALGEAPTEREALVQWIGSTSQRLT